MTEASIWCHHRFFLIDHKLFTNHLNRRTDLKNESGCLRT